MADIKLNDLNPAGFDLFADNEGYLNDLSEDELSIWGGNGDSDGGGFTLHLTLDNHSIETVLTASNPSDG
jgi:hypothetical protein